MTVLAFFTTIMLILLSVAKPLVYKPVAQKYDFGFSAAIMAYWIAFFVLLTLPFMGGRIVDIWPVIRENPKFFVLTLLKGVLAWYAVKFGQMVNKDSTSSSQFFPFISLALASLMLNVFFSENLKQLQLFCIVALGVLGIFFGLSGDVARMSKKWKINFMIAILFSAACPITDHICIRQIGWYPYFVFSNMFMLGMACMRKRFAQDLKIAVTDKDAIRAGFFIMLLEVTIISSCISVLPVSLVNFFRRLAAPIVMVYSAVRFKERTVKNQLIFGVLALLFALPIILG
ncbi:MAG: hypothetical protein J5896_04775 [Alphaproteobacteria bacterium]|nr:hypothetical protein [Alphaproteobacteria bacterium]